MGEIDFDTNPSIIKFKDEYIYYGRLNTSRQERRIYLRKSKDLLSWDDPVKINSLSLNGDVTKVDHILSDVVSGPIGNLPKNSSAVNFGKGLSLKPNNSDLAAGVINMVAQTILRTAIMSAISSGVSEIVIIGRTPKYKLLTNILEEGFKLYLSLIHI